MNIPDYAKNFDTEAAAAMAVRLLKLQGADTDAGSLDAHTAPVAEAYRVLFVAACGAAMLHGATLPEVEAIVSAFIEYRKAKARK